MSYNKQPSKCLIAQCSMSAKRNQSLLTAEPSLPPYERSVIVKVLVKLCKPKIGHHQDFSDIGRNPKYYTVIQRTSNLTTHNHSTAWFPSIPAKRNQRLLTSEKTIPFDERSVVGKVLTEFVKPKVFLCQEFSVGGRNPNVVHRPSIVV